MAIDVYLKIPTDPNYRENQIEVTDDFSIFLQQIEMILTTRRGEVLGDPEFGANLDDYLWSTSSNIEIESQIYSHIGRYCAELANRIPFNVNVNFIKGDIFDSILVDIEIDGTKVLGILAQ